MMDGKKRFKKAQESKRMNYSAKREHRPYKRFNYIP